MEGVPVDDNLSRHLAQHVVVDLLLVKAWHRAEAECLNNQWIVRGVFTELGEERVLVPYPSSVTVTPDRMAQWLEKAGDRRSVTVAIVERDGAVSYFALDPVADLLTPAEAFPETYNVPLASAGPGSK